MNEGPRRRRLRESEPVRPRKKEFPLVPLFIVVILAGFGMGALISRGFQKPASTTTTTTSTTVAAAPTESPVPAESPSPSPSPARSAAPRPSPHRVALKTSPPAASAAPTASAEPSTSPAPTAKPPASAAPSTPKPETPKPATPRPPTPRPATPKPPAPKPATPKPATAAPAPTGSAAAAATARTYLEALIRGDFASANTALGRGPDGTGFPEEEAVDRTSRITDVHTLSNGDGTYKVEIEVAGKKGTFYCTFQAARNEASAFYLPDHYCIRIQ